MKTAYEVKERFQADAITGDKNSVSIKEGARGALIRHMENYLGSPENRRRVLAWLASGIKKGELSSNMLTEGQWYALQRWIDPRKIEGDWIVQPDFPGECALVLAEALIEAGVEDQEQKEKPHGDRYLDENGELRKPRWFVG